MSTAARILVTDDEPGVGILIKRCLAIGGFEVEAVTSGAAMCRALRQHPYRLVILDLNLRGEDGLDLLREIRAEYDVPVIILSVRGDQVDKVVGLEMGADDYITKPFEPRELLARVRTVLRRREPGPALSPPGTGEAVLAFGDWRLDLGGRTLVRQDGVAADITPTQFDILVALATHPNRVLSRAQILEMARGRNIEPYDRSIDVHISQLRRKIERDYRAPEIIKTIYGMGYMFAKVAKKI
jgi:DNA-binding response OmpR family regulator